MPNFIITKDENGNYGLEEIVPDYSPGSLDSFLLTFFLDAKDDRSVEKDNDINYQEYIKSKAWKERSKIIKIKAGYCCQKCGIKGNQHTLHAHHLTYERLGHERIEDLMCLCGPCHKKIHDELEIEHA